MRQLARRDRRCAVQHGEPHDVIGAPRLGGNRAPARQLREIDGRRRPPEGRQGRPEAREVPLEEREAPPAPPAAHPHRLNQPLPHPGHRFQYYI